MSSSFLRSLAVRSLALALASASFGLAASAQPGDRGGGPTPCSPSTGPDVIVGDLQEIMGNAFSNLTPINGMDSMSMGTFSCNIGTQDLKWWAYLNQHPVIGQSLYVRKQVSGSWRFEQIGQSWLKHGFFALQMNLCCPTCTPSSQGDPGEYLGVGCSDPYTAPRNAEQWGLGPKSEVNPHTGEYPYPPTNPPYSGNGRRMQIPLAELAPTSATVQYFGEGQYVSPDDAFAGNQNNNASYRPIIVTPNGPGDYFFDLGGSTQRQQAALRAWKDVDPTVSELDVQVPGDGLFIVAHQVTNLGNGWWHYEYAVQNLNSDRCANSFSIPVPGCTQVQNIGFHDVHYRDGDGYFTTDVTPSNYESGDWAVAHTPSAITWSVQSHAQNPNANALRWGTTYNFRFDANQPPVAISGSLGLYKPGRPAGMSLAVQGPSGTNPPACIADVAGNDGVVNVTDLLAVISNWGSSPTAGDCAPNCGDGVVNVTDLLKVISEWGPCE